MTTYYSQNFDSATVPSLPTGWSCLTDGQGGTVQTSTAHAHSGSQSLCMAMSSATSEWAWANGVTDANFGSTVLDFWWLYTGSPTSWTSPMGHIRVQTQATTGGSGPANDYWFWCDIASNSSNSNGLYISTPNGTIASISAANWAGLFTAGTWYRTMFTVRDAMPGFDYSSSTGTTSMLVFSICFQRSDGYWLVSGGSSAPSWQNTGVQTTVLLAREYSSTFTYYGAGQSTIGVCITGSGTAIYFDDVSFYDFVQPPNIRSLPTWSPGNSVELMGTYISVDSGSSALSNISDGNFDTSYVSSATFEAWAGLDIGSGNTATLTRAWISAETDNAKEYLAREAWIEGSNNNTTWTSLGTSCSEADNRYNMIPLPVTAGAAYRYFRARNREWPAAFSELRFEGQISSGSPSWKPVRPTITPAAGKYANGSTITLSTPTTGASIYYTLAVYSPFTSVPLYGGNGSAPTTSSSLYSGPITLPSNQTTAVQAIAYDSSATTVYSDVTTGVFSCPQQYISDTGTTRFSTTNNWSEDLWDDDGRLLNNAHPSIFYDTGTGLYWMGLWDLNTAVVSGGTDDRSVYMYSSSDLYNWHYVFRFPYPPVSWRWPPGQDFSCAGIGRPSFWINPSPINGNNKYLMWAGALFCATAPAMTGPWTWQSFGYPNPSDTATGDSCLFWDSQTSTLWGIYANGSDENFHAQQLNSATDYTTYLSGGTLTLQSTGSRESPVMLFINGTYFFINSHIVAWGAGNSVMEYVAAAGSSLASVASALNAATLTSIWSSAPGSSAVAYNAQSCQCIPVPGRSGYLFSFNLCAPADSSANQTYHMRPLFYPLPNTAITTGGSPSISMGYPTTWTLNGNLPLNVSASGAVNLGSVAAGGAGGFTAPGSGAVTLGSITVAGAGGFTALSSGIITLGSLTVAGTGGFNAPGSGAVTLGSIAVVGAGSFKTPASGAIILGSITPAGSGGFTAPGSGAITFGGLSVAGSGGFIAPASGAITLGSIVPSGVGGFIAVASGSVALAALTVSGAGSYTAPGGSTGSGLITLASLTASGAGSFATAASGAITLGSIAPAGVGGFKATASGSVALAALMVAGTGSAAGPGVTTGSGAITLGSIIVTSAATGGGVGPLYLPYEFTSVLTAVGNVNPFDIDPEQTVLIDTGNADPFFIDPEQTRLITVGLTSTD